MTNENKLEDLLPDIKCSLTLEIMEEPVLTNNGISFEESEILKWLKTNKTCPITKEYLDESLLIKNYSLKNIISTLKTHKIEKEKIKKLNNVEIIDIKNRYIKIDPLNETKILIRNGKNLFNGNGIFYINKKKIYEGNISNNIIDGYGKYYKNNKLKYEGIFKMKENKLIIDGYGKEYYNNNKLKYEGTFKNSKKNGYGKLYNKEGDILYDGSFKNSKKEGYGKYIIIIIKI